MGGVIVRPCPHCPTENSFFRIVWDGPILEIRDHFNCCAMCGTCNLPICFIAVRNSTNSRPPHAVDGSIEPEFRVEEVWPARPLPSAPNHTPPQVKKRFEEGEYAYGRHNWNSAVAMYRSALDIATKGMDDVPKSLLFYDRLKWLHDNRKITPDIRSWADHVRVEGSAALHEPDEFSEPDATALRFFTEMFLRYVFELPGEVKKFRGETEGVISEK